MPGSLVKKLRIQSGQRVLVLNAPPGYVASLVDLPEGVTIEESGEGPFDFVHLFVRDSAQYHDLIGQATKAVVYDGLFWISYPKRSAKVKSDLSRDVFWGLAAELGLRPVTQVSVDATWSALRFRPAAEVGK
jgi:hypothetical protein